MKKVKLLLIALVLIGIYFLLQTILTVIFLAIIDAQVVATLCAELISSLLIIVGVMILQKKYDILKPEFKKAKRGSISAVFLGVVGIVAVSGIVNCLFTLVVYFHNNDFLVDTNIDNVFYTDSFLTIALSISFVVILAPVVEEILFRGILFKGICEAFGFMAGMMISSLVFGVLHMTSLSTMANGFAIGCMLVFVYTAYRNIILNIIVHGIYNLLILLIAYPLLEEDISGVYSDSNILIYCSIMIMIYSIVTFAIIRKFSRERKNYI